MKYDVISEIRLLKSMRIYVKNNPAKFHPNQIWDNGGLFEDGRPNNSNNKVSSDSDMVSVSDPKKSASNVTCVVIEQEQEE